MKKEYSLGMALRKVRHAKHMQQKDVLAKLNFSCDLSKIEIGVYLPSADILLELLKIYDISYNELMYFYINEIPTFHVQVLEYIRQNDSRISEMKLQYQLAILAESANHDINHYDKDVLLFHRVNCFYHLNKTSNMVEAKKHADFLYQHFIYHVNEPTLSDLDYIPIIIPTRNLIEVQNIVGESFSLLEKYQFVDSGKVNEIKARILLNYTKMLLVLEKYDLFIEISRQLEPIFIYHQQASHVCEFYMLKGLSLLLENPENYEFAITFIKNGLFLAKEQHYLNIYRSWKIYFQEKHIEI